jgi:hypothetical protein
VFLFENIHEVRFDLVVKWGRIRWIRVITSFFPIDFSVEFICSLFYDAFSVT